LRLRGRMLFPVTAAVAAISLVAGAALVERRRPLWLIPFQPLYRPLYDARGQQLFYLIDNESSQQACWHFAMLGHRLQHDSDSGSAIVLASRHTPPRYVAWTRAVSEAPVPALAEYAPIVSVPQGILFERRKASESSVSKAALE